MSGDKQNIKKNEKKDKFGIIRIKVSAIIFIWKYTKTPPMSIIKSSRFNVIY